MKRIKVKFIDYYWGNNPRYEGSSVYRFLAKNYDVEISEDPDYVFDGGCGHEYVKAKYRKPVLIMLMGENCVPDFNFFDYAIGFDHMEFEDRYLRRPLFSFYKEFALLGDESVKGNVDSEALLNRGFCSYVVTNPKGDPLRTEFFHKLSKYKRVASGGLHLNNVGGRVADKAKFCAQYKFNIAFENSVVSGYTTEKIMQPLSINVVPIYYGNPRIADDFNEGCMVRVKSRDDVDRAIEEIVALDKDDDAYLKKVLSPCLVHPVAWYTQQFETFLTSVLERPLSEAKRISRYGHQDDVREELRQMYALNDFVRSPLQMAKRTLSRLRI